MLDLSGVPMLDLAIGLSFMFFLLSLICSAVGEAIASALKLRAANLEVALRALLGAERKGSADAGPPPDDPQQRTAEQLVQEFFEHSRIAALEKPAGRLLDKTGWLRKRLGGAAAGPSYVSPQTAARVLFDTLAPEAAAEVATKPGQAAPTDLVELAGRDIDTLPNGRAKQWLVHALLEARQDVDAARKHLEDGFDEVMDRATGWYKRRMQVILFVIGLLVAIGLNADTFNVADRLSRDEALRARVVAEATRAAQATTAAPGTTTTRSATTTTTSATGGAVTASTTTEASTTVPSATAVDDVGASVDDVRQRVADARATALPLGWGGENVPHGKHAAWGWILKLCGFLATAFALTLGAPFWFDFLGRFANLRGTGNRIGTPKDDNLAPVDRDSRPVG